MEISKNHDERRIKNICIVISAEQRRMRKFLTRESKSSKIVRYGKQFKKIKNFEMMGKERNQHVFYKETCKHGICAVALVRWW